ncbi:MAG: hypothetical protein HY560_05480 [Gemmatimonadetes bacterium]|nr:hypothetical protein [Gemmatimonadota bacterium]
MIFNHSAVVAFCITGKPAKARVQAMLRAERLAGLELPPWPSLRDATSLREASALIHDLLLQCARLPLVRAVIQDPAERDIPALRTELRRAFAHDPVIHVMTLMVDFLPGRPSLVTRFVYEFLQLLDRRTGRRPTVAAIARAVGVSLRTLERTWREYALPSPKELADWATLLYLTYSAACSGESASALARSLGLDQQALHRLRRRLTPPPAHVHRHVPRHGDGEFRGAALAFAAACRSRRLKGVKLAEWMDQKERDPWSA